MPLEKEGSLMPNEVYALTAFLLYKHDIIKEDELMDSQSLPKSEDAEPRWIRPPGGVGAREAKARRLYQKVGNLSRCFGPPFGTEPASCSIGFSKLNSTAYWCLSTLQAPPRDVPCKGRGWDGSGCGLGGWSAIRTFAIIGHTRACGRERSC